MEGARSKGFGGFLTGTLKGVTGLITKPVSGTLDFLSKTAEGIKNTPKAIVNDYDPKEHRVWLPWVFYTNEQIIKQFDDMHAFIHIQLMRMSIIRPEDNDCFIDAFEIKKNKNILAVYDTKIIIYTLKEDNDLVRFFVFWEYLKRVDKTSPHKIQLT